MVDERVLHECLTFMENQLNKPGSKEAMERFFTAKAGKAHLAPRIKHHITTLFARQNVK